MDKDIPRCLEVLRSGGVIAYPTDTIWGLGCDATRADAVEKIYSIKQRSQAQSLLILLEHEGQLTRYLKEVPEIAYQLIEVSDKPLTIIYPEARNLAPNLLAEDGSIGIRIVRDAFCEKLLAAFRKPIVSTSANLHGEKSPAVFTEISEEILKKVDYVVQWRQDDTSRSAASSILKIGQKGEISIIRP
ncbi:MAG: L-threonylcarbamoyladenylate synthase [Bacteroidales bacterium]|nr:L-threonylcarbamoyladenylate synthase [Bacteroidales bacterium]